ncbi:MAG: peroxidase family protein, partial [Gammaproteobacteria bacterium]|nr:peroxidase family protein [Gammaproteobacteria bacterium]
MLKTLRLAALLLIPLGSGAYACPDVRSFDGSMNNCADGRALAGSAGSKLLRLGPAEYLDGASATDPLRPSARLVSATLASAGGAGISNARALSSFVFQWGQFLDHDLDLTPAGGAPLPIAVPAGDAYFDPHGLGNRAIAFTRSVFDPDTGTSGPRQQLNEITTWIDGSMLYGSSATRAGA